MQSSMNVTELLSNHALPQPGAARVWVLRQSDLPPVDRSRAGTVVYRDFAPRTYAFTAELYKGPTGQADTVQLAAGTQTYLQVQWIPSGQVGYPEAAWSANPTRLATYYVTGAGPGLYRDNDLSQPTLTLSD